MKFLFELGRTKDLCHLEFEQVLNASYPLVSRQYLTDFHVLVEGISEKDVHLLQDLLGSAIKASLVVIDTTDPLTEDGLLSKITDVLAERSQAGKVTFALGLIETSRFEEITERTIKEKLKEKGISARYITGTKEGLSASVLLHQGVSEILLHQKDNRTIVAVTIAIQNIDSWTIRDRRKPAFDKKHGMLPPKVARMMINCALPLEVEKKRVYDPFCGTGTVLLEVLELEGEPVGSDIRKDAIDQTTRNLVWYSEKFKKREAEFVVFAKDVVQVSVADTQGAVDAIVCEGYLGPLTPPEHKLENTFKGLEKLYKGAFKQWTRILKKGGRVCIALPRVVGKTKTYTLSPLVDGLTEFGYTTVSGSVIYDRPGAVVSREIFLLEFKG